MYALDNDLNQSAVQSPTHIVFINIIALACLTTCVSGRSLSLLEDTMPGSHL